MAFKLIFEDKGFSVSDIKKQLINGEYLLFPEWKKNIFLFLKEWFDASEYVKVQTSGSTGVPKMLKLEKEFLKDSAQRTIFYFSLKETNTLLLCLPAEYIAGKMMLVRALCGDMSVYAVEPKLQLNLPKKKIDFTAMIPLQLLNFQQNHKDLEFLETIILGGARVNEDQFQFCRMCDLKLYETYGMTETASHIALRALWEDDSFRVLKGISISLSSQGTLNISIGDRRFSTNDLVELKDNKNFVYKGRIDNVINSGGKKLLAEELEQRIYKETGIENYIIGIDSKTHGELAYLCVDRSNVGYKSVLLKSMRETFIQEEIIWLDEIPFGNNNKPDRIELKHKVISLLEKI